MFSKVNKIACLACLLLGWFGFQWFGSLTGYDIPDRFQEKIDDCERRNQGKRKCVLTAVPESWVVPDRGRYGN